MTLERGTKGVKRAGGWARRMLQGAVMVAVAASVPAAWSAGNQINNVAAGSASVARNGSVTTVTTGSRSTIINWQQLSVGSGETLNFVQPTSTSRVLNRIQGAQPTVIDGTLLSNGRVYMVNPAGVMFGNGAVINVNGLYAAAGHITDANFLAGKNQFTDNTGVVLNQGVIRADQIHLVGGSVANFGQIVTNGNGIVTMTAGKDVYIGETDSPTGSPSVLVRVSSDASTAKAGTGVTNSGTVDAGAGVLAMGAGDLYAAGIYNNGTLKAKDIKLDSHASTNVNEGTIDASSATGKGGTVQMLGDKVGVFAGTIDASGASGGGTVLIGGDVHGGGDVPVSSMAVVADGASVRADATSTGDGGEIIVFSSQYTAVGGQLSALPALGGIGGFIETSGLQNLVIHGAPLVGQGGTWLLDPFNLTVTTSPTNAEVNASFTAIGSGANINVADIITALESGNVTLSTGTAGGEAGTIHWNSGANIGDLSGSNTRTLTLTAASTITLSGNILVGGNDNLTLRLSSGADVVINGQINTSGGSVASTGSAFTLAGTITTGNGNVFLNHTGGIVTIGGILNLGTGTLTAHAASVAQSASTPITADTIALTLNGNADLNAAGNAVKNLTIVENLAGSTIGFTNTGTLSLGASTLGGSAFTLHDDSNTFVNDLLSNIGGTTTLIVADVDFGGSGSLTTGATGVVVITPLAASQAISVGVSGGSLTILDADLAKIGSVGTLTIGSGAQTGNITVDTVDMSAHSLGKFQLLGGTGTVTLADGGGTTPALSVPGDVAISAGAILASNGANNAPEIKTTGGAHIALTSGGAVGTSSDRIQIDSGTGSAALNVNAVSGVFLQGLGTPGTLAFEGNSTAASFDITAAGDINPAAAGGTLTATTTIVLNATGGIGLTGGLGIVAPTSASFTTHGNGTAGNIHILIPTAGATISGLTFTTSGTGTQTDTIDGAGDLSLLSGSPVPTTDALAVNASGNLFAAGQAITAAAISLRGGGNVDVSGGTLTTSSLTLAAGTGAGGASVNLTGVTYGGVLTNLDFEQDPSINRADLPALGATGVLTLISHNGVVTLGSDENLASLTAQGGTVILSGNATVSGNMSFTGILQLPAGATTLLGTGTASNLTISGSIAGATNDLTTNFAGATVLPGNITLNSLTVTGGGTAAFGSAGTVTTSGNVSIGENLTLNGDVAVTSAGGSVTFAGTIDSASTASHAALSVSAPGVIWFQGNIGAGVPLGGLTTGGAGVTQLGNGGSFAVHTGSPITFGTDVILIAHTTLTASGGTTGTVTFDKTVNSTAGSFYTLTITADDAVTFKDNVGAVNPLGALVVNATAVGTFLGSSAAISVITSDAGGAGSQSFNGPVTLLQNTTLSATGATGTIAVTGLVSSSTAEHYSLTVNAAGDKTFAGGTSVSTASDLFAIYSLGTGTTKFGGGSTITVLTVDSQTYDGPVVLQGNTTFEGTALAFNGTPVSVNAGGFDLTLVSNSMSFAGGANSVTGSGHLTLSPILASDNILIQTATDSVANTLVLGAADLANFGGFALTTIGRADGSGTLSVTVPTGFATSIQLLEGNTGEILLLAPLTTDGGSIVLQGPVVLGGGGAITLQSFGTSGVAGNIAILGTVNATTAESLNLAAGTGTASGNVSLSGVVGGNVPLGGLSVAGNVFTLDSNITTNGPIAVAASQMFIHGTGPSTVAIVTNGGAFTAPGVPIDASGSGTRNLILNTSATAGAASSIALGNVGLVTPLGDLTLNATGSAANGDIAVAAVALTGAFHSAGRAFTNSGTMTAAGATLTQTGVVTINAPIEAGTRNVDILGGSIANGIAGTITGGAITLLANTAGVSLAAPVNATGALSITGAAGVSSTINAFLTGSSVSIDGQSGNVTIGEVVNAAGGFTSTASGFFWLQAGAINVTNNPVTITHGGLVTLDAPIAAGSGDVSVTGADIASNSSGTITGGAIALLANTLGVNLGAPINAAGALSIAGNTGVITAAAGTLTASSATLNGGTGSVTIGAAIHATNGFTSTASGYFWLTTGSITTTNSPVTISHGGSVTLNGSIAAGTGTVNLTGGAGVFQTAGSITASLLSLGGAGTFSLPNLNAVGTLTAAVTGTLTFNNGSSFDVAGLTTNGGNLILAASPGTITFSGTSSAAAITLTATTVIINASMSGASLSVSNDLLTSAAAPVSVTGAVIVSGNATVGSALSAGTTLSVAGTVSGTGSLVAGTNVAVGGGFSADGGIVAGGSVSITGPVTMISGGSISAGNDINLLSGANMTGSLFAGGSILVGDTISNYSLIHGNMTAGGSISFSGTALLIGNATASGALTIAGGIATFSGFYSALSINASSNVMLVGDTTLTANGSAGMRLGSVVSSAGHDLTLVAVHTASTTTVGSIGVDGTPIGDVNFFSNGLTVLGGSVYGQNITFASAASTPATIVPRSTVPSRATIVHDGSMSGDLFLVAQNKFTMARNEKLTVYDSSDNNTTSTDPSVNASASLVIWGKSSASDAVQLGDVNVQGRLIVMAGTHGQGGIVFVNRLPGDVAGASTQDSGADIFVLGLHSPTLFTLPSGFTSSGFSLSDPSPIKFMGIIAVDNRSASSASARFQIAARDTAGAETAWFSAGNGSVINTKLLFVDQNPLTSPTQFVDPGTPNPPLTVPRLVRDIAVSGSTRIPAAAVTNVIPRDTQTITPERGQAISGALRDYLRDLGIYARDLRPDEIIEYLLGRGLYDDVPYVLNPGEGSHQVAVNRLPFDPVMPIVDRAKALLQKPVLDENGQPVLDDQGNPKYVSQTEDVAKAIGAAWQAYVDDLAAKNEEPKPLEFRAYCEAHTSDPKFTLALKYLNDIRELLAMIKNLGLTPEEYQVSRNKLLPPLRYANVTEEQFPQMIEGPSMAPGGDVVTAPPAAPAASAPQ
jgi:filamentous hemagglutinin family protein